MISSIKTPIETRQVFSRKDLSFLCFLYKFNVLHLVVNAKDYGFNIYNNIFNVYR